DLPQGDPAANHARHHRRRGDRLHPLGGQLRRPRCPWRRQGVDGRQSRGTAVPVGAQLAVRLGAVDADHDGGAARADRLDHARAQGRRPGMNPRLGQMGLGAFAFLFFLFIYAPLLLIIVYSFNSNPVNMMMWDHFTLEWYTGLFGLSERGPEIGDQNRALFLESTDQMLKALRTSLTVAAFTTTIATVVGTATAIALNRFRFKASPFYSGFLLLPMMMPDIVLGIGLLIFFVTIGMNLSMMTII